ncbi:hypothetical protein BC831DRAFT_268113 [Entophlyctis helioformis]|nr:hypothetical protein BC831DRAFT_268113 [Entophlyctis helioformis]
MHRQQSGTFPFTDRQMDRLQDCEHQARSRSCITAHAEPPLQLARSTAPAVFNPQRRLALLPKTFILTIKQAYIATMQTTATTALGPPPLSAAPLRTVPLVQALRRPPRTTLAVETPRTDAFLRDARDKLRQYALLDCIAAARRHASKPPRSEASDKVSRCPSWYASTDSQPSRASTLLTTISARACSYPSSRATTPSSSAAGPMTNYSGQYGLPESPSILSVSSTSPSSPVLSRSSASTGSSHVQREIISISSISNTDAHIEAGFDEATTPAQLSNSTGSQLVGLGLSGVMMPGSHARGSSPVARRKRSFDEFDDGEGAISSDGRHCGACGQHLASRRRLTAKSCIQHTLHSSPGPSKADYGYCCYTKYCICSKWNDAAATPPSWS